VSFAYEIRPFQLDPEAGMLSRHGTPTPLRARAIAVLRRSSSARTRIRTKGTHPRCRLVEPGGRGSQSRRSDIGDPVGHRLDPGRTCRRICPGAAQPACIWGQAERLREEIGAPQAPSEQPRCSRYVAVARAAIAASADFDLAWQEGRAMTLEQAIAWAQNGQDA